MAYFTYGHIFTCLGGIELVIIYRMRKLTLPPSNRAWWPETKENGRGMMAAAAMVSGGWVFHCVYGFTLTDIRIINDREKTIAEECNGRGCFQKYVHKQYAVACGL